MVTQHGPASLVVGGYADVRYGAARELDGP